METELAGKAAKNHANSDRSIIGGGTSDMYGHVKLTDSYTSNAGSASSGVAASSQALYNAYTALNKEVTESMGAITLGTSSNTMSWNSGTTLPYSFYTGSAVVYNNEIHILGGNGGSTSHYKWNGSSWSKVSTIPYTFYYGSAVVYNNEIHILGSSYRTDDITHPYADYHYKWNGSSWSRVSTLPYDFYTGSAVVYNNEIHILGGDGGYNDNHRRYHYKWNGSSWSEVSTLPYHFYQGSAVVYNNEIHILGGFSSNDYTEHYKWNGSSWSSVSTLPYSFYNGSAVVYNNEIHILGGMGSAYHYKWNGSSWSRVSTLPYYFYNGSAVVYNNEIHILGSSSNDLYRTSHYKSIPYSNTMYLKSGTVLTFPSNFVASISPTTYTSVSSNEIKITTSGTYTIKTYAPLSIF